MRRRIFFSLASLALLAFPPGSLPATAGDPPTTAPSAAPEQATEKQRWEQVKVHRNAPSRMVEALKKQVQGDITKLGVNRLTSYDADSVLLVQGTPEGIAAFRERVRAMDTPQVLIYVSVYRFRLSPEGVWKKDIVNAPVFSTSVGHPAKISEADKLEFGFSVEVMPVHGNDGSVTIKAKGELLTAKSVAPETISTAVADGRVGSGPVLRLMLAPPGQGEKTLGIPAPSAMSANPLTESGITFFYLVEITSRFSGETPADLVK